MLTLKTILAFIGGLLESLALPMLAYLKGRGDVKSKYIKDQNKRLSNRPRTDNDALNRLRKWRDKRKDRGK